MVLNILPKKYFCENDNCYADGCTTILFGVNPCFFFLQVSARDSKNVELEPSSEILIEVDDINDNPPVFSNGIHHVYVKEGSPPGTLLFIILIIKNMVTHGAISEKVINNRIFLHKEYFMDKGCHRCLRDLYRFHIF